MTDVQTVPVTAEQARMLTDRIKVAVDGTWILIQEAYVSRAWAALGYTSWDDYCTREFGTSRLRLPREERQEVVASLREIGMSTRAIAAATGTNRETIRQEIAAGGKKLPPPEPRPPVVPPRVEPTPEAPAATPPAPPPPPAPAPRPITGTDGKTYHQPVARPQQKQRTDVVATVNRALLRAQEAARAADDITRLHLAERTEEAAVWARSLSTSLVSLQRLQDLLNGES